MIWASSKPLALYSSGGIGHCWGSLTKDELLCPLIGHVRTAVPNTVSVTTKKNKKTEADGSWILSATARCAPGRTTPPKQKAEKPPTWSSAFSSEDIRGRRISQWRSRPPDFACSMAGAEKTSLQFTLFFP